MLRTTIDYGIDLGTTNSAIALATGGTSSSPYGHYLALGADGKVTGWANYLQPGGIYGETNLSALSNSIITAIATLSILLLCNYSRRH